MMKKIYFIGNYLKNTKTKQKKEKNKEKKEKKIIIEI